MLVKMAAAYRRPLVAFYLGRPPPKADAGVDFRRFAGRDAPVGEPLVHALVREVVARQGIVREVLREEEAAEAGFVGMFSAVDGPQAAVDAVAGLIGDHHPDRAATADEAFNVLRRQVESAGAFVLLKGDLGSYQTAIDTDAFRGFALADRVAPFIVINDNDARTAWSFTLIHELAHVLLGQTGISDNRAETRVEQFCNDVASEYLLPQVALSGLAVPVTFDGLVETIGALADEHKVSRALVAYRLRRAGLIGQEDYGRAVGLFRSQWLDNRERERERNREEPGGPSYYAVRRHRVGGALMDLVRRSLRGDALSTTKAAIALGVKPTQVQPMLAGAEA